jgi:hypothetical protein
MGMLGELGAEPAALEPFSETPGLRETRACFRKQLMGTRSWSGAPASPPAGEPFLVQFDLAPSLGAIPEETMTLAEVLQQVEEGRQKLRDEGRREGRRAGESALLLRQLRGRFGELPAAIVARVEAAEPEVLEVWGDRVLTARSLDEVLGAS